MPNSITQSSPAAAVRKYLLAEYLSHNYPDKSFIGKMPDEPSDCIVFFDTGGDDQDPRNAIMNAHVQICARTAHYEDGYEAMAEIQSRLVGAPKEEGSYTPGRTIGQAQIPDQLLSFTITGIWSMGQIAFTHYDERGRAVFSSNYRVVLEPPRGYIDPRTNIEGIGHRHAV